MVEKTITIKYKFGSEFQENLALELLSAIMKAYKIELEKNHQKNKVEVTIK